MTLAVLCQRTQVSATTLANTQWRSTAGTRTRTMEASLVSTTATAGPIGLGVPAVSAIQPYEEYSIREDEADPQGTTRGAVAWFTSPTAPTIYKRRCYLPAVAGVGVIWTFPQGLTMPMGSFLVVFNIAAVAIFDVNILLDE